MNQIKISEKYEGLFNTPKGVDTIVVTGGRYSVKSFAVGLSTCIHSVSNHRILYTRYTLTSADDSIIPEFNEKIDILGWESKFNVTKGRIEVLEGKGKIVFKGIKTSSGNQTASLKSLKDFSMFVLEEAEEMPNFDDWNKIKLSIRATDVNNVSILVLNPTTKEHWVYEKFFEDKGVQEGFNGVKDNVLYIHTTYKDCPREFIPDNIYDEFTQKEKAYNYYLSLSKEDKEVCDKKIIKDYRYYKHTILGGWLDKAEGVIYEDWNIGEFDDSLPYTYGLDFGSNDPDSLVKVAVNEDTKQIFLKEEFFKSNTSYEALCKVLENRCGYRDLIVGDCAERRVIRDLRDLGFNIVKAKKPAGSVDMTIKLIQSYTLIVDPESINLKKALNNYRWHDNKSGVPNHDWSDLCDAFRYAVVDIIGYRVGIL